MCIRDRNRARAIDEPNANCPPEGAADGSSGQIRKRGLATDNSQSTEQMPLLQTPIFDDATPNYGSRNPDLGGGRACTSEHSGSVSPLQLTETRPPDIVGVSNWQPSCSCNAATVPATVLDPFVGSGTTVAVAQSLGRMGIGTDLNPEYLEIARKYISRADGITLNLGI